MTAFALILAVGSTLIGLLAALRLFRWNDAIPQMTVKELKISILKPIRGMEFDLEANLHSFFNLNKTIPFELLFSVKSPSDPAIGIVEKLMAMHPDVDARLFVATPDWGKNPKVSNMHYAWNRAQSDLLLISDSNVRVESDYLELIMAERIKGSDLVSQAVYGADAQSFGGHLDVIHLNTFYLKATSFLELLGVANVMGKCMFFSRSEFDQIGGLGAVKNYLAEDLVAGTMMKEAGYRVTLAPRLLRQTTVMTSFRAYWNRHVRWARLRKCHYPLAYIAEPLLFESLWPVAWFLLAENPTQRMLAIGCFGAQFFTNLALHSLKFRDSGSWKSFNYLFVKDLIAPLIWISGLLSNKVVWRGQTLQLRFGGKLGRRRSAFKRMKRIIVNRF